MIAKNREVTRLQMDTRCEVDLLHSANAELEQWLRAGILPLEKGEWLRDLLNEIYPKRQPLPKVIPTDTEPAVSLVWKYNGDEEWSATHKGYQLYAGDDEGRCWWALHRDAGVNDFITLEERDADSLGLAKIEAEEALRRALSIESSLDEVQANAASD